MSQNCIPSSSLSQYLDSSKKHRTEQQHCRSARPCCSTSSEWPCPLPCIVAMSSSNRSTWINALHGCVCWSVSGLQWGTKRFQRANARQTWLRRWRCVLAFSAAQPLGLSLLERRDRIGVNVITPTTSSLIGDCCHFGAEVTWLDHRHEGGVEGRELCCRLTEDFFEGFLGGLADISNWCPCAPSWRFTYLVGYSPPAPLPFPGHQGNGCDAPISYRTRRSPPLCLILSVLEQTCRVLVCCCVTLEVACILSHGFSSREFESGIRGRSRVLEGHKVKDCLTVWSVASRACSQWAQLDAGVMQRTFAELPNSFYCGFCVALFGDWSGAVRTKYSFMQQVRQQ